MASTHPDCPPENPGWSTEVNGALLWVGVHPFPEESLVLHLLSDQTARHCDLLCAYNHLYPTYHTVNSVFSEHVLLPNRSDDISFNVLSMRTECKAYHMLAIQQLLCNNGRQTPKHMGPSIYDHRLQRRIQAVSKTHVRSVSP